MADPSLSLMQIVVLALVQGITEFLPISSSAHLILVPVLTGWPDQGVEIDIAVHVGTLGAVLIYFRRDVAAALRGLVGVVSGDRGAEARLAMALLVATLPLIAVGAGLVALDLAGYLRAPTVIAGATIALALVLYGADRWCPRDRGLERLDWRGALAVGLMQTLALVPGASRAGVAITGARLLGISRIEAARFSMLLSIPAILAAGGYATWHVVAGGRAEFGLTALAAALLSFLAALASIYLLMRWLGRSDFTPFVVYRLALGGVLLWYFWGG